MQKFEWINTHYIKELPDDKLIGYLLPYLEKEEFWEKNPNVKILQRALPDIRNRLKVLSEIGGLIKIYFAVSPHDIGMYLSEKMKVDKTMALQALQEGLNILQQIPENDFTQDTVKDALLKKVETLGWKNGQLLWPLRVALSGEQFSPGTFELLGILQKQESLKRISAAIKRLS